jgi:hypothetical protein
MTQGMPERKPIDWISSYPLLPLRRTPLTNSVPQGRLRVAQDAVLG